MSASKLKTGTGMIYFLFYQAPILQEDPSLKLVQFADPTVSLCIYTKGCTLHHSAPLFKEKWTTQWAADPQFYRGGACEGPASVGQSTSVWCLKQNGCFSMWRIKLQRRDLADNPGQHQFQETESEFIITNNANDNGDANTDAH